MERHKLALCRFLPEPFQGGVFGCGGKSEVGGVALHFPFLHQLQNCILHFILISAQRAVEVVCRRTALRAVRFVNDHGKPLAG